MTYFHGHRREDDDPCEAPPPVTLEQLEFFTEQTDKAVRKALAKFSRRAVLGFVVLFLASLGNVWYASHISKGARSAVVNSGYAVAIDGCNRDFRSTETLRLLLKSSRALTLQAAKSGNISRDRINESLRFYDSQLEALKLPDCRKSDDVITDDPQASIMIPEPLYPGSPGANPRAG